MLFFRGLRDLLRRLRLSTTTERERVRLDRLVERERECRVREGGGSGDLLRRGSGERLVERLPPPRLTGVRDRLAGRRFRPTERECERRLTVVRRGDRVLERRAADLDLDRRFLRGDGDRRSPRLGDSFLLGGLRCRRLGDADNDLLLRLGEVDNDWRLDLLGDLTFFFLLGDRERDVERDSFLSLFGEPEWRSGLFGDREADFLSDLGEWEVERECERCLACGGETDRLASDMDLDRERSLESLSAVAKACVCWRLALGVEDRLRLDPERLIPGALWGDPDRDLEPSCPVPGALWFTLTSSFRAGTSCDTVPSCLGMMSGSAWLKLPSPWFPSILPSASAGWAWSWPAEGDVTCTDPLVLPFFPAEGNTSFSVLSSCLS